MSTPTAAIWTDATNDAIGAVAKKAASPAPNSTDSIWTAAVNDARGIKTPTPPAAQTSGPGSEFWRGSPSVPGLPMMESQTMTPQKFQQGAITAGQTAAAGAVAGGAALGGAALLAPSAGTATVGTGVLGPAGEEITKDIATQGPSLARAGINAAVSAIKAHPVITGYVATHIANAIGIPLPKVLKAIMLIPGAAE